MTFWWVTEEEHTALPTNSRLTASLAIFGRKSVSSPSGSRCKPSISPCHTFPGKPCGQITGDNFCCLQFPTKSTHLSVFHTDPESVHASPIYPQTSFEQAQNFVRISRGYLHADVIAKHQQEARKGRNLLVYNPLKGNKPLDKLSSCRWVKTQWHACAVTLMSNWQVKPCICNLTHWGWDKMAATSQTLF